MNRKRRRKTRPSESSLPAEPSQPFEPSQPARISKKIYRIRGASMLKKYTKMIAEGKRLEITLNEEGQVDCENSAKLATYIGTTAKRIVPITLESWNLVPEEDLDQIWSDVTAAFILPNFWKDWALKKANDSWRNFKKDLRRNHLKDKKTEVINTCVPSIYDSYITQEQWTEFVRISLSEEFKEKSKKFKALSELNDNGYRASKKGYVGVASKYRADNKLDKSTKISRAILYKEARRDKNGNFSEKSLEVVEKIDEYLEKEKNGEFVSNGRNDVLAMALDKQEHPGRVRGVGGDVSVSHYFGHASRRALPSKVLQPEEIVSEATKRAKAEFESMFEEERQANKLIIQTLLEERKQYMPDKPLPEMPSFALNTTVTQLPTSIKGSCSTTKDSPFSTTLNGTSPCRLCWPTVDTEVAKGIVYHSCNDVVLLHNHPLRSDQLKVSVVTPVEAAKEVRVPFPTDETRTVSDAVGQFIAWPKHLVFTIEEDMRNSIIKEPANIKDIDPTPSILEDFRWMLDEFGESSMQHVKIPKSLFNSDLSDVSIGKEQVQIWLDKKELDMCHVSIYLRYLFETHGKDRNKIFGFLCPSLVSSHVDCGSLKDRARYIANSIKGNIENKLYFAPYKTGSRWVLLVLNPYNGYAYWIDPLQRGQDMDADQLVDLSFTFIFAELQKNKLKKQPLWHIIKCPQHQDPINSGYYVLRFIKEIMRRNSVSIPKIWYGKKESFSTSEVDEIRKEWIEYLLQLMF